MRPNEHGRIAAECWQWLAGQYAYVDLDEWVLMPNHLHGIITIQDDLGRGGSRTALTPPAPTIPSTEKRKPLGRLVGAFKTVSTKRINELRRTAGFTVWHRNYYEHIIRSEKAMNRIREYIFNNPLRWEFDRENLKGQVDKSEKDFWETVGAR
jgi:REP element-mobilizing transposase RayT